MIDVVLAAGQVLLMIGYGATLRVMNGMHKVLVIQDMQIRALTEACLSDQADGDH